MSCLVSNLLFLMSGENSLVGCNRVTETLVNHQQVKIIVQGKHSHIAQGGLKWCQRYDCVVKAGTSNKRIWHLHMDLHQDLQHQELGIPRS